jgi:hypothetical protein
VDEDTIGRKATFTCPEILDRDPDLCAVCDNSAASNESLMGIRSCTTCYLFLATSMDQPELSLNFCCPEGERGYLCKLGDAEKRCSYCWLRRCEIEGQFEKRLDKSSLVH